MSGYQAGINQAAKKSSTQVVLEAVRDLHAQEQVVTRETLAELTGLKLGVVDDRVSVLIEDGLVHRVQRGVFMPTEVHPPARVLSKTLLPDGTVKIDIGDQVLTLTPKEDRMLAAIQAGVVMQTAAIEVGHQAATVSAELAMQVKSLRRELAAVRNSMAAGNTAQLDMLGASA